VIVYEGTSKLKKTRLDVIGAKGYANGFAGLIEFISSHIPSNELVGKAIRTEVKMFSSSSIRELVANALIHQDFNETGTSVTIEIYSDRIEVVNPGIPILSTERFIDEYQSRNERLADLMRRMGICEEQGKGIDRVISHAEVYQLPAPDFRASERHTTAVLFASKGFDKMDRKERVRACFQHCVLRWMTNERMDNQSLRERFKLPEKKTETASRIIRDAMNDGKIKAEDPLNLSKRYAKYVPWWA
jgi:ATP-dependent DNA helicase RecG